MPEPFTLATECSQGAETSNRLPVLAAEIKTAHLGVVDAAKTAAERVLARLARRMARR